MKLWTLIIQPQAFFQRLYHQPINLWVPLGIVLSAGWLRYIALFLWTRNLPQILPVKFLQQMTAKADGNLFWIGMGVIGLLCWPLISWGIYGWIIHGLTRCRWRAWQLAGWTYWPVAMVGLIMVGVAGVMPATGRVLPYRQFLALRPEEPWFSQYQTWLGVYRQVLQDQTFLPLSFWLILIGSFGSLWLLYGGVKVLSPAKAALTTSILTLWMLIYRVL